MEDRPTTADSVAETAKALADGTRRSVLRLIQESGRALGVRELADAIDVHPNAVRKHLAVLLHAGLITEHRVHSGAVGRPRTEYTPNPDSIGRLGGWNPYEVLSVLLTSVAAGRPPREVGEEYGRRVAASSPDTPASELVAAMMQHHGFQPTVSSGADGALLVLGRCPFSSAAAVHPLVCDLHEGIAAGIAERAGEHSVTLERRPPDRGGCLLAITSLAQEGATA